MIKWDIYDIATNQHIQTAFLTNAEFYSGLLIGVILALIFWVMVKGAE